MKRPCHTNNQSTILATRIIYEPVLFFYGRRDDEAEDKLQYDPSHAVVSSIGQLSDI